MTKPDTHKHMRNIFATVFVILLTSSVVLANYATWWVEVIDYWMIVFSFGLMLPTAAAGIATLVAHFEYHDSLRTN